jgi:hypothetical protein
MTLPSVRGQAMVCESDLQVVIFVWPLGTRCAKADRAVGHHIGEALMQEAGNSPGPARKAAALDGEHLERQIPA